MFDGSRFFQWSHWVDLSPSPLSSLGLGIGFGIFAALVVGGVVLRVLSRARKGSQWKEVFERSGRLSLTMGFLGLLLLFFSYERIRLFGARFWYIFWLIGVLVWAGFIAYYATKVLPQKQAAEAVTREKAKYLPSRQKRRK